MHVSEAKWVQRFERFSSRMRGVAPQLNSVLLAQVGDKAALVSVSLTEFILEEPPAQIEL